MVLFPTPSGLEFRNGVTTFPQVYRWTGSVLTVPHQEDPDIPPHDLLLTRPRISRAFVEK